MTGASKPRRRGSAVVWVIAIFVVALFGVYAWKQLEIREIRKEQADLQAAFDSQQAKFDMARKGIEGRFRAALLQQSQELLRLSALSIGGAVRPEAMRGKDPVTEQYLLALVKQPSVSRVALIDARGTIAHSTDAKLTGEKASEFFWGLPEGEEEPVLQEVKDEYWIIAPVKDGRKRVGTLVATFSQDRLARMLQKRSESETEPEAGAP